MEAKILYGKWRKSSANVFVAQSFSKVLRVRGNVDFHRCWSGIITLQLPHLLL